MDYIVLLKRAILQGNFKYDLVELNAEKQNHHPDIIVHYDNVKLSITNHEKGKVTDKCHKLASAINKVK